jgi:hypothetical protein
MLFYISASNMGFLWWDFTAVVYTNFENTLIVVWNQLAAQRKLPDVELAEKQRLTDEVIEIIPKDLVVD